MNIEQLLYEYPYIKERLESIILEIKHISAQRSGAYGGLQCPLSRFGEAPLAQGRVGDPTGQAAVLLCDKLDDKLERLRIEKRQLELYIKQVDAWMLLLETKEKEVMDQRYFKRRSWRQVSNEMGCTRQNCEKYRQKALAKIR